MTALLLASTLAAAAVLTFFHLRPAGTRRPEAVPSVQHLFGRSLRRRRLFHLEERLAFGLRMAALLLAGFGLLAWRSGCTEEVRPVALLDPAAPAEAARQAAARAKPAALLGFEGSQPLTEGDVPLGVKAALHACSDTRAACLLRAARLTARTPLVVGPLASAEWQLALARFGQPFYFLRTEAAPAPAEEAPALPPPVASVRPVGTSPLAQGWAAALAVAAQEAHLGPDGPRVAVASGGQPPSTALTDALTVVAVDVPTAAGPDAPAVEAHEARGLLLPDPLDLAAGTPGLGLLTSLTVRPDAHFHGVLPLFAMREAEGRRELVVAASAEELGNWAHQGNLLPLARALLAAGLVSPVAVANPPVGGALGWRDKGGQRAPVGLLDVPPGEYLREDGRVALRLQRTVVPGTASLSEAELQRLGGRPFPPPVERPSPSGLLLGAALALWLAGVWRTRRAWRAWLPAAGVTAGLGLLWADVHLQAAPEAPWEAVLGFPPGARGEQLLALARDVGVGLHPKGDAAAPPCASPRAPTPCTLLGTVGLAEAPQEGTDILLFDAKRPRLDVLRVEAPREVPLGAAAQLWVTVRVRRASGQRLTLSAHSPSLAPASSQLEVEGVDMVRTVALEVSPLTEGISFLAVEAAVDGEPQAQDGRLLALATRRRHARRLLLAAAPGWEARAAADALQTPDASVEVLAQLGSRAVVARGRPAQKPLSLLQRPEALAGVELLALVGFGPGALDGAAAAGLRRYVAQGGAALLLDAPGAAGALGVGLTPLPAGAPLQPLAGQLEGDAVAFRGYMPEEASFMPPLTAVLGRLGPKGERASRPWVLGRGLGQGRLAVVAAPDVWRLSAPGDSQAAYRLWLARLCGWLQAPRASRTGVALSEDWASLRVLDGGQPGVSPLPATGPLDGLPVETLDVQALLHWPRARLRAAAAAAGHPFLEVDGAEALAAAWRRLPRAPRWQTAVPLRSSDWAWCALAMLLALEAAARRLYGAGGSRTRTDVSSSDMGGTPSGEGRSQRDSATPAARAASLRDATSSAA